MAQPCSCSALWLFLLALALQISSAMLASGPQRGPAGTPRAPDARLLDLAGFGEPLLVGRLAGLYVQTFDLQQGRVRAFAELDYPRLLAWLELINTLDPAGDYPLALAAGIYGGAGSPQQSRLMFDFVERKFLRAPDRRWKWLAHAVVMSRHRLHDLPLATRYAEAIPRWARGPEVPIWVLELPVLLHMEGGNAQRARELSRQLLDDSRLNDPVEREFLRRYLDTGARDGPGGNG